MKKSANELKIQVGIAIDPAIKKEAKLYAVTHGITISHLYEEAVKAYMEAKQ